MEIKGFTLIELLFTMILFATLAFLGVASTSYLMDKNEQQTLTDEIRSAVQYAKIQAIVLGNPVCLSALDPNFNWSKGMTLTRLSKKTNEKELLYQWQWHHPHWIVAWSGINSPRKIIVSNNPITAISNGQFRLTNIQTKVEVVLVLNRLGRIRLKGSQNK
ncbi:MAG: GspH/FimT family pseudopilin [Gammaproteobacteria bacterium]